MSNENAVSEAPVIAAFDRFPAEAISDVIRSAYPESKLKSDPAYIAWRLDGNPLGTTREGSFCFVQAGDLVGCVSTTKDRTHVEGGTLEVVWPYDLGIAEPFKTGPLAIDAVYALLATVTRLPDTKMALGVAPKLEGLYKALRWKEAGSFDQLFFVLNPVAVVNLSRGLSGWKRRLVRAAGLLAPPVAIALRAKAGARAKLGAGWDVARHDDPVLASAAVTELALEVAAVYNLTDRSPEVWAWRATRRPAGKCFALVLSHGGASRGVLLCKTMGRPGVGEWLEVVDLLVRPGDRDAIVELARCAVRVAVKDGLQFVRMRMSAVEVCSTFLADGWLARPRSYANKVLFHTKSRETAERLSGREWWITGFVNDGSDYGADEL